ncbi:hypothetical protein FRC00_000877, partial [Tulasnella sp. 408]
PSIKATASEARSQHFADLLASELWEEIESWVHLTMGVKEALCVDFRVIDASNPD